MTPREQPQQTESLAERICTALIAVHRLKAERCSIGRRALYEAVNDLWALHYDVIR